MKARLILLILGLASLLVACTQALTLETATTSYTVDPEAGRTVEDAEARGARALMLYDSSQSAAFRLDEVPSGTYKVSVRARAQAYKGWPVLRLNLNGQPLGRDNLVKRERYGEGAQQFGEATLKTGQVITAEFVNDLYEGSGKDRNLIVDYLSLEPLDVPKPEPDAGDTNVQTLIGDMRLPHESKPRGVPSRYDWQREPRVGMGNDPGDFRALTAWGQLYEGAQGNPATNTRVQIRNLQTYVLSRSSGTWQRVQFAPTVKGAAYRADYQNNANRPADIRKEASGGVSVTAGDGYNFHFWPSKRVAIRPDDIAGVVTTVQARLVIADKKRFDDRAKARYILSMGADYWRDQEVAWNGWGPDAHVGDAGIGRFKHVEKDWRLFTMNTLSAEVLRDNPPPLRY